MIYGAGERLGAHLVRVTKFAIRRWRGGLDPDEVYAYLRLVADEMEQLQREATTARTEADRIRQGLRQWQARHVGCKFADPPNQSPDRHPQPRTSRRQTGGRGRDEPPRNGGHW